MKCTPRFVHVALVMTSCLIAIVGCQKNQPSSEVGKQATVATGDQSGQEVSREALISVLESKSFDQTVSVTNRIKAMHYQGDLIPLLKNIWGGNLADLPRVDKAFVEHPRIRLEIADILLQSSRNNSGFNLDPKAYTAYARGLVNSEDSEVARQAIVVVGIANDPVDLPVFEKILAQENDATYRATALEYTMNCAVNKEAIERIKMSIKKEENRSYLNEAWTDYQGTRQSVCKK
jgi:HEAT repeat protein